MNQSAATVPKTPNVATSKKRKRNNNAAAAPANVKRTRRNVKQVAYNTDTLMHGRSIWSDISQADVFIVSAHGEYIYELGRNGADSVFFTNKDPHAYIAYTTGISEYCIATIDDYIHDIMQQPAALLATYVGHYEGGRRRGNRRTRKHRTRREHRSLRQGRGTRRQSGSARAERGVSQTFSGSARAERNVGQTFSGSARAERNVGQTFSGSARAERNVGQTFRAAASTHAISRPPPEEFMIPTARPSSILEHLAHNIYFALPGTTKCPNTSIDMRPQPTNTMVHGVTFYSPQKGSAPEYAINKDIRANLAATLEEGPMDLEYVAMSISHARNMHGIKRPYVIVVNTCSATNKIDEVTTHALSQAMRENHYTFLEYLGRESVPTNIGVARHKQTTSPPVFAMMDDKEIYERLVDYYEYLPTMDITADYNGDNIVIDYFSRANLELHFGGLAGDGVSYDFSIEAADEGSAARVSRMEEGDVLKIVRDLARHLAPILEHVIVRLTRGNRQYIGKVTGDERPQVYIDAVGTAAAAAGSVL